MNRPVAIPCVFLLILCGCSRPGPGTVNAKPVESTRMTTGHPIKKTLHHVIEQPATIEAFEETPLVAHISGYVDKVLVDIGSRVKGPRPGAKGEETKKADVLAELSVPELEQELKQKRALVVQASAEVDQAKASLEAAEAHTLTDKALVLEAESTRARAEANYDRWKSEFARVEELVASKVVDKQIRDETLNQYRAAEANRQEVEAKVQAAQAHVRESEAKRNKARADIETAKAHVLVAQAEEGRQTALLEYRFIRAPYDGVVTRRNIHTGHFLQPNASGGPGVLFVVARTDVLRIQLEIPETEAPYIVEGVQGKIRIPTMREQTFDGKIARTSWTLDARARTLRAEIDYHDSEGKLRPGMYANVTFTVEFPDRFTLPSSAIFTQTDRPSCYRVQSGKAILTPLKLGVRDGNDVEVLQMLKSGSAPAESATWQAVTGEEEVILTNLGSVTDGKEVAQ